MKWLEVGFFALCLSSCAAEFTKDQFRQIMDITRVCYTKLDISKESDLVDKIFYHKNLTYNDQEAKYILCYHREAGWLDPQNIYHSEKVVNFFAQNEQLDRKQLEELIDLCLERDSVLDKMLDRAVKFYRCFWDKKKFSL